MPQEDPIQPSRCAEQLKALAAPERLQIIRFLRDGPRNVTEIAEMLRTKPVNVTHHIGVLRGARMLRRRKSGRKVFYSLWPGFVEPGATGKTHRLNLGCCWLELPAG